MATKRPNIVFIMADDHASKAISCYGAGINHTPNIDRLATGGMRFNHCYVTNSICTPSRAAILTGTHNHVNGVMTLNDNINKYIPNVAKHMRTGGYRTAMVGKWHLGEGVAHEPSGFDYWSILPGQGDYWDPTFIEPTGDKVEPGYVTDIVTDKCLNWMTEASTTGQPFFVMCHHKAPHRSWECDDKHKQLYKEPIRVPETYDDDYKNRAKAAKIAKMRVAEDLTYQDLGLIQPDGGDRIGERVTQESGSAQRKVPTNATKLIDKDDGTVFTFDGANELAQFKFQRYMQRYLRTIQSIDDNVGRMLDYLEQKGLAENTIVIYTSDQGFFLGEHGWFDKRFMYEESFQMPFLIRYPAEIQAGTTCDDIICNVDFAPTFLDYAQLPVPSYMQGESFRALLGGKTPDDWQQIAYHRYWMHNDIIHHAYAHYGVRDQRYKLIYWYNDDMGMKGARPGGEEHREWELFDCQKDPLELFNVYNDPEYRGIVEHMTKLLELKMFLPANPAQEDLRTCGHNYVYFPSIYLYLIEAVQAMNPFLGSFQAGVAPNGVCDACRWRKPGRPRRLRGTRACIFCRRKKRHNRPCVYPEPVRSMQAESPLSTSTEGDEDASIAGRLRGLVDVYFDKIYPLPSQAFLHPATTRERCSGGMVDQALAYAIYQHTRAQADTWNKRAEQIILNHLESPTISRLQALLLIISYQMQVGLFQRAFMLMATAARYAAAMRLNHERPDLDLVTQEVRRRILWSLKIAERYFSVGLPEFEACPIETIYLQFPCPEAEFSSDGAGDGGAYGLFVQLELIRRHIMKLTRAVSLCEQPYAPLIRLIADLKGDLDKIGSQLDLDTGQSLAFASVETQDSHWLRRQVFTLISFHQANCDLHRILLHDYPEAAPRIVLDAVDEVHTEAAQRGCLEHAMAVVHLLTSLNQNSTSALLLEFDTAICTYHAVRLILFIARSGRGTNRPTPEFAASRADLCLVAMKRFFAHSALVKPIIDDMERLLKGQIPQECVVGGLTSPPEFQEGRRRMEQQLSSAAKARQRLAIHSLLRRADFTDEDE
ncbi:alkaline-phosphatase-like protein [Xylaria castorea]|nr:alkaline-phosphatase-like protein [Xylaria castorea]